MVLAPVLSALQTLANLTLIIALYCKLYYIILLVHEKGNIDLNICLGLQN